MTRKEMQDRLVKSLGMEDEMVIEFFKLCEQYPESDWNNKCLFGIFEAMLNLVQFRAELEE